MIRIFKVSTELVDGTRYSHYNVAAKNFKEAVKKVTDKEITPYNVGEQISEVQILASEGK